MPENDTDQDPKDLRAQLEAANKALREEQAKTASYTKDEQLRESGFGHLNKLQRSVLMNQAGEGDLDPEAVKKIATDLGFPLEAPKPSPTVTDPAPTNGTDPGTAPTPDQQVQQSLAGFDAARSANEVALRGNIDPSLETKIREAKSPEELTSLLRKEGHRGGLVHSWDVD